MTTLDIPPGWTLPPTDWLWPWTPVSVLLAVAAWYLCYRMALVGGVRGMVLTWAGYKLQQWAPPLSDAKRIAWRQIVAKEVTAVGFRIDYQQAHANRQLLLLEDSDGNWLLECLVCPGGNINRYRGMPLLLDNEAHARHNLERAKLWLLDGHSQPT